MIGLPATPADFHQLCPARDPPSPGQTASVSSARRGRRPRRFTARLIPVSTDPRSVLPLESPGFDLGTVLLAGSGLFCLATLFFGTRGGYYDSDDYDGNGTTH